jgi:hypothetical protein
MSVDCRKVEAICVECSTFGVIMKIDNNPFHAALSARRQLGVSSVSAGRQLKSVGFCREASCSDPAISLDHTARAKIIVRSAPVFIRLSLLPSWQRFQLSATSQRHHMIAMY